MKINKIMLLLFILGTLSFTACGTGGGADLAPDAVRTMAVMTFQAQLTQTAWAAPTATGTPSPTGTPIVIVTFASPGGTSGDLATDIAAESGETVSETADECYDLKFVEDVSIPDYTVIEQGQSFTKSWLVSNIGTCAWEPGFIFNVVSGETLNGVAVTLDQTVQPGWQHQLSVSMVAPKDVTGNLKSVWQLADADNNFFGEGVYVIIEVVPAP